MAGRSAYSVTELYELRKNALLLVKYWPTDSAEPVTNVTFALEKCHGHLELERAPSK